MHVFVDVEADGPCAGLNSMIGIGLVVVKNNKYHIFDRQMAPLPSMLYDPKALKAIGVTREETLNYGNPIQAIDDAFDFLREISDGSKLIFWSDNNGFDWSFWNYYCHAFKGENPFGFSSRRIGDFYAGLCRDIRGASGFKKFRITKHTHHAGDDAKGNAEAFTAFMALEKLRY